MSEYGTWVYGVAPDVEAGVLAGVTGVAGETVRTVSGSGLTAVVGTVPLATFGEEALHRNLENLDWLAGVAQAHDSVVTTVARSGAVVPFRMATVYFDDERVRTLLRDGAAWFGETLARITGHSEWGVKVLLNVDRLPEKAPVTAGGSPSGGAGAAYLRRKREQQMTREHVDQLAVRRAEEIHATLTALAVDARLNRPHSPALAKQDAPMILNGAYLVDNRAVAEFADAVSAQNDRNDEVDIELTGPWPAYSFTTSGQNP